MKIVLFAWLFLFPVLPGFSQGISNPRFAVMEIFKAAQTGNYSRLAFLCDPHQSNDIDVKVFCELETSKPEVKKLFVEYFAKGYITGEPEIKDNLAKVKIVFGPKLEETETIVLVNREGFWYFYSM